MKRLFSKPPIAGIMRISLVFDLAMIVRDPDTATFRLWILPLFFGETSIEKVIAASIWKEGLEVKLIGAAWQHAFTLSKIAFVCEQIRLRKATITLQETGGTYGRILEYDTVSHTIVLQYYRPVLYRSRRLLGSFLKRSVQVFLRPS